MLDVTHSILLIGPTGSGKSYFARSALKALGSGLVAMVPGSNEENSYFDLLKQPGYIFQGFDDTEYQPILGDMEAKGLERLLRWLKTLNAQLTADPTKKPAVLVIDTASGVGRMAFNKTMAKFGLSEPPAAQSPSGAAFYGFMRMAQESVWRLVSAIKGRGVHIIATAHPKEVEQVSEAALPSDIALGKKLMIDVPGGFRETLPGAFDLVFANIVRTEDMKDKEGKLVGKKRHFRLQHIPDARRPTKSRWGDLGAGVPNTWPELMERIEKAATARVAQ